MEPSSTNSPVLKICEVAALDSAAVKANPWAVSASLILNGAVLALMFYFGTHSMTYGDPHSAPSLSSDELRLMVWRAAHFGGGGGTRALVNPVSGRLPKFERQPIVEPQVPVIERPRLAVDPSIAVLPDVKIPEDANLIRIGVPNSPVVTLISNGQGREGGMGTGARGGDGPGYGSGSGPGSKSGLGVCGPGSGVKPPTVISAPTAEFSDEARRAKFQGVCLISLIVDSQGNPQNLRVIRALGMGLDEKALEAVGRYKFKPAMLNNRPVAAMVTVEVNFRLF